MNELNETQETILIECLRAIDGGAAIDECLARYPQHTDALRPYLELHARLQTLDQPEPSAVAYREGRQALLERIARQPQETKRSLAPIFGALSGRVRRFAVGGWMQAPLARVAVAGVLLFVLSGGALGASAAGGFQPSRDVLDALGVIEDPPPDRTDLPPQTEGDEHPDANADEGTENADDGIDNAPIAADPGRDNADHHADEGQGNAEELGPEVLPAEPTHGPDVTPEPTHRPDVLPAEPTHGPDVLPAVATPEPIHGPDVLPAEPTHRPDGVPVEPNHVP